MNPLYALYSDDMHMVHIGPSDDVAWDTYSLCTSARKTGPVHRVKTMFRVVGVDRFATCLQCIVVLDGIYRGW